MTTHQRSSRSFLVGLALAPVVTFGAVAPAVADDGIPDVPIDPGVGEPGTPEEPGDPGIDPGTPEEPPTNEIPEPPVDPGADTGTPEDPAPADPAPAPADPAPADPAPASADPAPAPAAPVAAPVPSAFAQPAVPSSAAVPPAPATPTVAAPAPAAGKHARSWAPAQCFTYTIVSGDTLSEIAERYGVPGGWPALADANQDIIANPDLIFPGQNIRIPC